MARKIIDKLFPHQSVLSEESHLVSMKDWKDLVSRVDHIQTQIESNHETINAIYSKVSKWMELMRDKINAVSNTQAEMDSATKNMFKEWEAKLLNWVQPEQRKEDQRRIMDLMRRHSQFIQSYSLQIDSVKKTLSKNEYQMYQLLEQMRSMRIELDFINSEKRNTKARNSGSNQEVGSYSDLFS